jgi:RHS repeat-associated protein
VPSGASVTFNFNVTAPATAGTHNFQWSMLEEGVSYFAASGPIAQVKVGLDKAEFVSQSVPAEMSPGQSYPVGVTMKNIGTTTWQPGTVSLGSQNPADNTTWGLTRAALAAAVAPGANATFSFNVTAPSAPGVHNFQWRLVDGASSWFGPLSPNLAVSVSADNAAFVSQSVPAQMSPGQAYSAMVTLQNTGVSTWTAAQGYRLGSANPEGNTTWGASTFDLPFDVPPGTTVTVPFNAIAPASAGTYNFQWRMLHGSSPFGAATPNVAVNVATSGATLPGMDFIHVDHLNTPRLVANAAGQTVWRWDQQEPFGNNPADQNPSGLGIFDLPLRLPGQTYDAETGLHYNYYRNYDASTGGYKESDLIGLRGGINTYAYVAGSPLIFKDPLGLDYSEWMNNALNPPVEQPPAGKPKCSSICVFEVKPDCRPGDTQCAMASAAAGLRMSTKTHYYSCKCVLTFGLIGKVGGAIVSQKVVNRVAASTTSSIVKGAAQVINGPAGIAAGATAGLISVSNECEVVPGEDCCQ